MGFVHKIMNWHTGVLATNDNRKRTLREDEQAVSNTFHSDCIPPFCIFVLNSGTSHTWIQSDLLSFVPLILTHSFGLHCFYFPWQAVFQGTFSLLEMSIKSPCSSELVG